VNRATVTAVAAAVETAVLTTTPGWTSWKTGWTPPSPTGGKAVGQGTPGVEGVAIAPAGGGGGGGGGVEDDDADSFGGRLLV
jgi:hypothetical protein